MRLHLGFKLQSFSFILPVILLMSFHSSAQLSEKHYRIYSVAQGKEISLNDIAKDMAKHDVLFFGEEHNDSVTHYLQARMLELLFNEYGEKTALSMEMFDRDVQTVMNEYLSGSIREKQFTKDARAWNNYRDYRPMVEFAKANKMDVICANAPTRYTNLAGRKGQQALRELPAVSKKYFAPLPYDTATGAYYKKLSELSHTPPPVTSPGTDTITKATPIPVMSMGNFNMILAQSLWDATMAYSISDYLKKNKGKKVLQVNGRFHSDEGYAAVTQLKKYRSRAKTLIISSASDDSFPNIDWSKYTSQGDYIIITDPSVPRTYKE